MPYDINSQQVDIENLFKQNANDLSSIKELYRKLKDLEEKITQIKYIDSKLAEKLKKEYENLKRVILDENIQAELSNDINKINNDINEISSQLDTKANEVDVRKNNVLIDTKDITDTLRQQISGNAPIMASLEDKVVSPIKTNFFDIEVDYTNIFNIETCEVGAMDIANGNLSENTSFSRATFIPVTENTEYVFSVDNLVSSNLSQLCFYDKNKIFISALTNINKFTTPEKTSFISVCVYGTFPEKSQIEKGTECTPYKPYKQLLKNDGIKEEVLPKVFRRIEPMELQISQLFEYREIDVVVEKGYYQNNSFTANASYDSTKIKCKKGEKYLITTYILGVTGFPIARFYDNSFVEISNTGAITTDTKVTDYEIVVPSDGYITVTSRNDSGTFLSIKKYSTNIVATTSKPTDGLKFIAIGDSITAESNRWRDQFIKRTGAKEIMCTAVPGAHLADYSDTVLNGTNFEEHGNTVCNQIQKIINNPPSETPDFIIISAITNDTLTYEQLLESADVDVFIGSSYPNYSNVDDVDRTIIDGAMRWQVEKLYELFPNVKIFFASPIQAYEGIRSTWNIIMKEQKLIRVANKMGIKVIKASTESGIYGRYENNGTNGKHLSDGLHPNVEGGIVLGNYYASQVINYYSYK